MSIPSGGKLLLYHGTDDESAVSIMTIPSGKFWPFPPPYRHGVDLFYSKDRDTDFGKGFYVTRSEEYARYWARQRRDRLKKRRPNISAQVLLFEVDQSEFDQLNVKRYSDATSDYWQFVRNNRAGNWDPNNNSHDVITGPVVKLPLKNNEIWPFPKFDQLCFYTPKALTILSTPTIVLNTGRPIIF